MVSSKKTVAITTDSLIAALEINNLDVALELGCEAGSLAAELASRALWVHCASESVSDVKAARQANTTRNNIEFHNTRYAELDGLKGKGVSKAFALKVFQQANFYDLVFHLQAIHSILNEGGLLLFTFHDGDCFRLDDKSDAFGIALKSFRTNRVTALFKHHQLVSLAMLQRLLPQLGFEFVSLRRINGSLTEAVVRKCT